LKRVAKDAGPSLASWFETRFALLTMRVVLSSRHCERREAIHISARGKMDCFVATLLAMTWMVHLFKKFSGNPGRGQSIAISSPLPDSVM
jgi:hypothetical protein